MHRSVSTQPLTAGNGRALAGAPFERARYESCNSLRWEANMGELKDKIKGKVKQVEGAVTGDRGKQAEGIIDETKGKIKETFEDIKHDIRK
jgi:uncharacterized protein YjbJ (UPF0337 family)